MSKILQDLVGNSRPQALDEWYSDPWSTPGSPVDVPNLLLLEVTAMGIHT